MTFIQEHPVITLWLLWVVIVPVGPLIGMLLRRRWSAVSRPTRRILAAIAALSVSVTLLTMFTPWSLRGFWADAINFALSYVAVWTLCSLPYRHARWLGENGRVLIGFPSALLAVFTYTVIPFVLFTDGLVPDSVLEVRPGLVARISQFGWETMNTDIVELVRPPRGFPVIEHSEHKWVSSDVTCAFGKLHVNAEPNSNWVVSTCLDNPDLHDRAFVR